MFNFVNPFIRCSYTFGCSNTNETVHFKFDRFVTENRYDFFVVGDPDTFDTDDLATADYMYYYTYDYVPTGKALILDGSQPTGIWVTADSIQNFDLYFFRMVFESKQKFGTW